MQKNISNQVPSRLSLMSKGNKGWSASLDWLLASGQIEKLTDEQFDDTEATSNDVSLLEKNINQYAQEAEEGIAQIQDPLWRRVCVDILNILGPVAFKDLWRIKLTTVSPQGKRAYFECPNQDIAATIEHYHFVIIDALKKFYPFLSSIEAEVSEDKICKTKVHLNSDLIVSFYGRSL